MSTNAVEYKPWRSFAEQLDKLILQGLEVDNRTKALQYLERLGYYRLSGYWYGLRQIDKERLQAQNKGIRASIFVPGSRFETAVKLYVFDKKLRLLALDALERIEMAVRVDIAYLLGKYHPLAHTQAQHLHGCFAKQIKSKGPAKGRTEHALWLDKYKVLLHRARREPFIIHNQQKYGEPPVWVAIEIWDFGLMSKLYAGMKHADQNTIAAKYGAMNGKELTAWLRSLNFIRNVAAHHSRLWNINILERCPVPTHNTHWGTLNNQRPFLYFCLMHHLLKTICPSSGWGRRFVALLDEFPYQQGLTVKDLGLQSRQQVNEIFND